MRRPIALLAACALMSVCHRPAHAWVAPAEAGVHLTAVAADPRGGATVAGARWEDGSLDSTLYVARYSARGELVWRHEEPGGTFEAPADANALAVDRSGDYYVAGTAQAGQLLLLKLDGDTGETLWEADLHAPDSTRLGWASALALDGSGRLVVGGTFTGGSYDLSVVARVDAATGAVRWQWQEPGTEVRAVALARNGDVAATGGFLAIKLNGANGSPRWRLARSRTAIGRRGYPLARTIAVDRSGDVIVGGMLRTTSPDARAFYVARLASQNGAVRWEVAGPPQYTFETPARLALDGSGRIYAGGRYQRLPAALRLDKPGQLAWLKRPWPGDPQADSTPGVTDLAVDASGLFVSGAADTGRFSVAALSLQGALRWRQDVGPGTAAALAPAPGGRVYAVGQLSVARGEPPSAALVALDAKSGASISTLR